MKNLKNKLSDFNTSLKQLQKDEKEGKRIEQCHFGDFLMIKEESPTFERYKVWLINPVNIADLGYKWMIEYSGEQNGYKWETIKKG